MKAWRWLFGLGMLIAGPCHFVNGANNLVLATASAQWPTASATVVSSKVVEHRGRGVNYSPSIEYEYIVQGTQYRGSNVWLMDYGADHGWASDVVAQFPLGSSVPVKYDVEDPRRAVLKAERNWFMWFTAAAGLLGFVMGLLVCPAVDLWGMLTRRYPSLKALQRRAV